MSITDSESLKRQRTYAKGRFTRTINNLRRSLDDEHYCIDIINSMFNDANDSWKNVNEKHDNYIASSETDDFTESDEWIGEIQQRFYDVRKMVTKIKADDQIKRDVLKATRIRDLGYTNFRSMCSNIDHLIATKCPIASIERERTVILQQFNDAKQSHNNLSVLLVEDDDKVSRDWLIELVSEFSEINRIIDTYVMSADGLTPKAGYIVYINRMARTKQTEKR